MNNKFLVCEDFDKSNSEYATTSRDKFHGSADRGKILVQHTTKIYGGAPNLGKREPE